MTARKTARRYEEVDVTPKMATDWLDNMIERNRKERKVATGRYAQDMADPVTEEDIAAEPADHWGVRTVRRNGRNVEEPCRWLITGDTVKISPEGQMWDGGQRMRSLQQAKALNPDLVSIRMVVGYNLPASGIKATDRGAKRTFVETLRFEGVTQYVPNIGAVLRRVTLWKKGNYADVRGGNSRHAPVTDTDLLRVWRANPGLFDAAARRGADFASQRLCTPTAAATAYYLFHEIDEQECKAFFDGVISGDKPNEKWPPWQLRERLRRAYNTRGYGSEALDTTQQLALFVMAWNLYRRDELISRQSLALPRGGLTNANFPQPE